MRISTLVGVASLCWLAATGCQTPATSPATPDRDGVPLLVEPQWGEGARPTEQFSWVLDTGAPLEDPSSCPYKPRCFNVYYGAQICKNSCGDIWWRFELNEGPRCFDFRTGTPLRCPS